MTEPVCGYCAEWQEISEDDHAWLLSFEDRGLIGWLQLVDRFEVNADSNKNPGELTWEHFLRFVSTHNWKEPAAVYGLAEHLHGAISRRVDKNFPTAFHAPSSAAS